MSIFSNFPESCLLIDLSKTFDSINHGLLLRKLEAYGIHGKDLCWFSNYLTGREQRVSMNGTFSNWSPVSMGVPQGSILGPLLFLLFVNDLPKTVIDCTINLYADDTAIYHADKDPVKVQNAVNSDLDRIVEWTKSNKLQINIMKTQAMTLCRRAAKKQADEIAIRLEGSIIPKLHSVKYLGVTIDENLSWKLHIASVRKKALSAIITTIKRGCSYLPTATKKLLYNALVLPHFDYCSTVWHPCNEKLRQSIESVQNYSMRIILNKPPRTPSAPLREQLKWTTLHQRRHNSILYQVHRCILGMAPPYLSSKFVRNSTYYDKTRGADKIHLSKPNTEIYRKSFEYYGALQYNQLTKEIRDLPTTGMFKQALLANNNSYYTM